MIFEFTNLQRPYFHITESSKYEIKTKFSKEVITEKHVVKEVLGNKCMSYEELLSEFSESLEFPDYFGFNWNALDECLNDLDWLGGNSYLLIIYDTELVLLDDDNNFKILVSILQRSVDEWTFGRNYDEFPTPPTPFHVLFHCETGKADEIKSKLNCYGITELNNINF